MCLAIPAKIVEKDGEKGIVNLGGVKKEIMFTFTPEARNWRLGFNAYRICSKCNFRRRCQ